MFAREQPPWQSLLLRKEKPAMPHKDLRSFLECLEKEGQLLELA